MRLRRKPDPAPDCPCGCRQLEQRLAEYEALNSAIIRTVVALRPRQGNHGIAAGLIGWGVDPDDASVIAAAWPRR